ncbi:hypothetical protein DXG01_009357 [Tephrocybe rancida]|nr:hypothetical protein DXG01_009357 [Tephrocybe rancida]
MDTDATGAGAIKIDDREKADEEIVETNVIDSEQTSVSDSNHESPMVSPTFHSPTTEIIGTPFTTDSRFEYPFPNIDPPDSSTVILSSSFSSSISAPAPTPAASAYSLNGLTSAPASHTSFPPLFSFPTNLPSYSLTHPKMRSTPPPVPPSLAKKRQRWTLALPLLRRRNSQPPDEAHAVVVESRDTRSVSIDIIPQEEAPNLTRK